MDCGVLLPGPTVPPSYDNDDEEKATVKVATKRG